MSCIEIDGLSKSYGSVKAVNNITMSIKSGQVFGFLGPNGAGKSTTIKLLTTLIQPSGGTLTIHGVDAIKNPLKVRFARLATIQIVCQVYTEPVPLVFTAERILNTN